MLALTAAALLGVTACTSDSGDASATITVDSGTDTCTLSEETAAAGNVVFEVTNSGTETAEFYVYGADGEEVVSEVEDITPDSTRELTADLDAGTYITACKPGSTGDGIRGDFTVTE